MKKLTDKGKEWIREIEQNAEKKKECASLQDAEQVLDELEVQSKSNENQGKSMAKMETPVKGMEWLRSKDERLNDVGLEILVKEKRETLLKGKWK